MLEDPQSSNKRLVITVVAVSVLVLFAGCASITASSTVDSSGTIETHKVVASMPQETFSQVSGQTEQQGYDTVCEFAKDAYNESNYEEASCDRSTEGSETTITLTLQEFTPGEDSRINVTETDGNVTYVDALDSSYRINDVELTYTVDMPGQIHDSNADTLENNDQTAKWTVSEDEQPPERIYVKSGTDPGILGLLPDIKPQNVLVVLSILGLGGYVYYFRSDKFENPEISRE
ncbi:hypothetical protein [Natronorubrum thiooxidans]|uniref:DUF3153 domain-containing protein n=1 Tax=Natronorubrum thiooxidans TaxID=308853 RepID=A0A1N7H354_9EURY|nr:hypothetical protein [Natronorubrum thiooxidans]SIS19261.1 hypothetical protein SAMN05421752_12223 [Natronorubrum thiooxidans]